MSNKGILKVAEVKGSFVATEEWGIREQIIASAICGILSAIPFEAEVHVTLDHSDSCIVLTASGAITLRTTISHNNRDLDKFAFLEEAGPQRAHDLCDVMSTVISAYNDSTVRE